MPGRTVAWLQSTGVGASFERFAHYEVGRQAFYQSVGLRSVAFLAGREEEADGAAKPAHRHMDLGTQAAAGSSESLIFRPPFLAPEAC